MSDQICSKPEFNPGDKPFLRLGNEVLNNNIPWSEVLRDVIEKGQLSISQIAGRLGTSINTLRDLEDGNKCQLSFKQGARLLNLQLIACDEID